MEQKKTGAFIAACRKEQGMTQIQFAEKLGVTNKAVSKWETGRCMPDASLFDDICLLLGITLNELFAGERIASEDIPGKAEENLKSMAMDHQKVDLKIEFCRYGTILLAIAAVSINLKVGGMWFEGLPVFSNLAAAVLLVVLWFLFLNWTREDIMTQKAAVVINAVFFVSSLSAFILDFWGAGGEIVLIVGFPCEMIFYGFRMIMEWIQIYLMAAIAAVIGLIYAKRNAAAAVH